MSAAPFLPSHLYGTVAALQCCGSA